MFETTNGRWTNVEYHDEHRRTLLNIDYIEATTVKQSVAGNRNNETKSRTRRKRSMKVTGLNGRVR